MHTTCSLPFFFLISLSPYAFFAFSSVSLKSVPYTQLIEDRCSPQILGVLTKQYGRLRPNDVTDMTSCAHAYILNFTHTKFVENTTVNYQMQRHHLTSTFCKK